MPSNLANGNYTLMWYWDWTKNDGKIYSACADVVVGGAASGSTTGTKTTTGAQSATSTSGAQTATSGAQTATSTSGGTGGNPSGCESVIMATAPKTVTATSNFNVTIGYRAQGSRDIVVDLINGNSWYGKGMATVAAGKGAVVVTVMTQNNPPTGSTYQLHAWSVNQGQGNVANAYNSAYDNDLKTVTVGNRVSY
jgi:hypothetical protein